MDTPESHDGPRSDLAASSSVPAEAEPFRVAVIGNPNTGKTTLFNALTGLSQHTGNYPGVTVETALGTFLHDGRKFLAVDLPGTYSLAPRAPDEMIAVSVLLGYGEGTVEPDCVLAVADASNLDRNLYLVTQILDLGRPTVVALTMLDVAEKQGVHIDVAALQKRLGVRVVPVQAVKRQGLDRLRQAVCDTLREAAPRARLVTFPPAFHAEVATLARRLAGPDGAPPLPDFLVERLLFDAGGKLERDVADRHGAPALDHVRAARGRLNGTAARLPALETDTRYAAIADIVRNVRQTEPHPSVAETGRTDWTARLDAVVTHKVWGLAVFLAVMGVTFQSIFSWTVPFMDVLDGVVSGAGDWVGGTLPPGPLRSLLVDGVIGGVGAVVVFLPQIAILFGLIAVLEDSGYMARAAFLMDRVMAGFGLSGRSFIPLLSSFACAVPGIMAARTIDNRRDRIATILIAPLMSCSARLPVYVLFISAFIPAQTVWGVVGLQGLTLFVMYALGLVVAPPIAWLLKRTMLSGEPIPFLMELPPFKLPAWRVVVFRMYDRSLAFLRRAGSIILATTILVWALSYYPHSEPRPDPHPAPHSPQNSAEMDGKAVVTGAAEPVESAAFEDAAAGQRLGNSYLGRAGRAIEPFVEPLGWDWKIGMATLASFPAREVVIAALGTIYNLGADQSEDSVELRDAMRAETWPDGRPIFTPLVAVSIMVFFALCCQCGATLATIKRETDSWGYPAFTFVYMTGLAYLAALAVYQIGSRLG